MILYNLLMQIDSFGLTDKGRKRESNQDSFLVNDELGLYIVADGMGGHQGGEVASSLAVETVEEVFKSNLKMNVSPRDLLIMAYSNANKRIFEHAYDNPELNGMGTTMVLCMIRDKTMYIANVGDSRCYLFKNEKLWQLTEDHSLINEQIRAGVIPKEQAKLYVGKYAGKNVITRSVGYEPEVVVDIIEREISPGDTFILCSDGLTSMVLDQQIEKLLYRVPISEKCKVCVDAALNNGGDDNVTVLSIGIE